MKVCVCVCVLEVQDGGYLGVYSRLPDGVYTNHSDPVARDNLVCEVLATVQLHMTRELSLWYSVRALLKL